MITPIRSLTLLLIAIAHLFANADAFSIEIDQVEFVREWSHPRSLVDVISFNNKAFFLNTSPPGLWISDGTATGTKEIISITPSIPSTYPSWSFIHNKYWHAGDASSLNNNPVVLNGYFYFSTYDIYGDPNLWRSNGTAEGTVRVKQIMAERINSYALLNDILFLLLDVKTDWSYHYCSLWRTDGTATGTWEVVSLNRASNLVAFKGKLYFSHTNSSWGKELWVSDGTAEGTEIFKDINPKPGSGSSPKHFIINNNTLYFVGYDGDSYELWRSDGTQAGTVMVTDNQQTPLWSHYSPVGLGKHILFQGNDDVHGVELWRTDGTQSGTTLLKDLEPGTASSGPLTYFTPIKNDELYFKTLKGFWKTDGTTNGTKLLKNLFNSPVYLSRRSDSTAIVLDNRLYFGLNISEDYVEEELWVTDGTSNGTNKVTEFVSARVTDRRKSTILNNFVAVGDMVLFTETYPVYSAEGLKYKQKLFKLERGTTPLSVPPFLLPLLLEQ